MPIFQGAPSIVNPLSAGRPSTETAIVIRGIGTFAYSIAAEPSVLVVIDDVAVGYQAQAFSDLVDIDRVPDGYLSFGSAFGSTAR